MNIKKRVNGFATNNTKTTKTRKRRIDRLYEASVHQVYVDKGQWKELLKCLKEKAKHFKSTDLNKKLLFDEAIATAQNHLYQSSAILHCEFLSFEPHHRDALRNACIVFRRIGEIGLSLEIIKDYIKKYPDCASGLNTYGTILNEIGKSDKALAIYTKAIQLDPKSAQLHSNIAGIYHLMGNIDDAYAHSCQATNLMPDSESILMDHLIFARRACALEDIRKVNWNKLLTKLPSTIIRNIFLQSLVGCESKAETKKQLELLRHWSNGLTRKPQEKLDICQTGPTSGRIRKRVGILSGDFKKHSVARFLMPLFKNACKFDIELYSYKTSSEEDKVTQQFRNLSAKFTDVSQINATSLSSMIRKDRLDILIDITGFTRGSRTGDLANRCAPIQASWLGYPGSTGLPEMDYLFLDKYSSPTDQSLISEQVLLTNGCWICTDPLEEIQITKDLPLQKRGYITFGSLNNPYKLTRDTLRRWAQTMAGVENSRLLLIRREYSSYYLRINIIAIFESFGIAGNRINFMDNQKANRHYLDCYNEIDITLDTYPVTGGTTTLDSIWMGVPVVTLEGDSVHQRVSSAILKHAGHSEMVATSGSEFVALGKELALNPIYLKKMRNSLRDETKNSLLLDGESFTREFKAAIDAAVKSSHDEH